MAVLGRPRGFDRDAALNAAMLVFWRKGFAEASMNDLCDAMGIRSPSLYAAFGSKEALYVEAVEDYARTIGPPVWGKLAEGATARDGVENLLLAAAATMPGSSAKPAGCMATLATVGSDWPPAMVEVVGKVRRDMQSALRARLDDGLADGELPASIDLESLNRFYLGVYQGMAIQARDGATSVQLRELVEMAMTAWPSS